MLMIYHISSYFSCGIRDSYASLSQFKINKKIMAFILLNYNLKIYIYIYFFFNSKDMFDKFLVQNHFFRICFKNKLFANFFSYSPRFY